MKKIFICFSMAAALAMACKTKSSKSGSGTDSTGSVEVSSEKDANQIIDYTNSIIDVTKKYNEAALSATKYYDDLLEMWAGQRSFASPSVYMNILWTQKEKAKIAFGKPTAALGGDVKFFEDSVGKYHSLFQQFQQQDSALQLYVKAEDFKDDHYAKGKDIMAKQFDIYNQLAGLRLHLNKKIEVIADAAEEISLKDSPIKDAFKAAKTDLAKFKNVADLIADKDNFTDADLAAIDAAYNDLNASIEKNKAIDKTSLDKANKTSSYDRFYQTLVQESATIKPVIRNIKNTKKLTKNDFETIDDRYSSVVSSYNSWVN